MNRKCHGNQVTFIQLSEHSSDGNNERVSERERERDGGGKEGGGMEVGGREVCKEK